MSTRLLVKQQTRCNTSTVRELVPIERATQTAQAMASLYKECLAQIVRDETISFHVLMMPSMTGHHYTYALQEDEFLAQDIANLNNVVIHPQDCLVVLGRDILFQEIGEDDMLRIVLSDVAVHIRRLKRLANDENSCHGKTISWTAICSAIACAHPIMKTFTGIDENADEPEVLIFAEEIRRTAVRAIIKDRKYNALHPETMCDESAYFVIDKICSNASKTNGGYLSLPASIAAIQEVATELVFEAMSEYAEIES